DVVSELTERLLDGWNPDDIAEHMAHQRLDREILARWARQTEPEDEFRWDLRPEMDYLDP
ncbi:MAG: hypothetical protein VX290_01995, partial [Candidatus Latescibacterota bacterium]|nr:hypothetical protein [Candidatus Latescibacterota bacterium]